MYRVVYAESNSMADAVYDLEKDVKALVDEGWMIHGHAQLAVAVGSQINFMRFVVMQTMIKEGKIDDFRMARKGERKPKHKEQADLPGQEGR